MRLLAINGLRFTVTMPKRERERHKRTSFRDNNIKRAGNFCLWDSWSALIEDEVIGSAFIESVNDLLLTEYQHRERFSLQHPDRAVGWSISTPLSYAYRERGTMDTVRTNKRTTLIRVTDRNIFAPLTDIVTFALRIEDGYGAVPIIVEEVFPGSDFGPFSGDLRKKGRAFFMPDHPGGDEVLRENL